MDNTHTTFPDSSWDVIYWDPSHFIRPGKNTELHLRNMRYYRKRTGRTSPNLFDMYGYWKSRDEWLKNLAGVNREFYRLLKPKGLLYAKIADAGNDSTVRIADVREGMTNFTITEDRTTDSLSNIGKSIVHWLTMKKAQAAPEPSSASSDAAASEGPVMPIIEGAD
jgi:DNA modification methylase